MLRHFPVWSLVYGVAGFAAGFLFGLLRELILIPSFGVAVGHVLEFPVVTLVVAAIGLLIGQRSTGAALLIGLGGAAVLLAIESTFALLILGEPLVDYLAGFDVIRGALFPYGLAIMAVSPWLGRKWG